MRPNHFAMAITAKAICPVLSVTLVLGLCPVVWGQGQITEPVYRTAREANVAEGTAAPAPVAAPVAAPAVPFDLTQKPGEHPLAPAVRVWKEVLANIDQNVRDYSCTLVKRERLDGDLGDPQYVSLKVRNQPFSVYMKFQKPYTGREVLYVEGQNNNELTVLDCGWKRMAGKLNLDPNGMVAMQGQKHPITMVGIRFLTTELIKDFEADMQFGESQVTSDPNSRIGDRPATLIQIEHPVPRRNFRSHVTRVFIDNELRVPIHYDAFLWPEQAGGERPLEESYTYVNLKLNNGFTAQDFSADNPAIFQK